MGLVKFSSDFLLDTFTLVDNLFITEHLPYLDEKQVKVYLYGLYLCTVPEKQNSLDALCAVLDMTEAEVLGAYGYFEDMGLCRIISKSPLEVSYLSIKKANQPPKKYRGEKWHDFNTQLQQLFPDRMLMINEFNEYYMFIDSTHMEQDAMLMIVQYCINLKGLSVRYPYILTVARNWAADNVRTVADVEERLKEYENQSEQMRQVLSALGRKGAAELEDKQLLLKWTRSWGYEIDAILAAVKSLKSGKTFAKLDRKLDEFYRMSIFTVEQIKDYQAQIEKLKAIAVSVNKNLGVYYESLDHELEVYIAPWTAKGFGEDALRSLAHYCYITNVRTLEGMNNVVNKFFTLGLLTEASIEEYLRAQIARDGKIRKIIEKSGSSRQVTQSDRDIYRTWTADWGFDDKLIEYAAAQAVGRTYPTPYINQLLSSYRKNGINTVEDAEKFSAISAARPAPQANFEQREYSDDELRSIITSIDKLSEDDI